MATASVPNHVADPPELNLLLAYPARRSLRSWAGIGLLSVVCQFFLFFLLLQLAGISESVPEQPTVIVHKTPLYLPPQLLTQHERNRISPPSNVSLADLLARQANAARTPSPDGGRRHVQPPKVQANQPNQTPPQIQPPPELSAHAGAPQSPAGVVAGSPLPPAPSPLQTGPQGSPAPQTQAPAFRMPHASVDNAIKSLAQNPSARRTVVADASPSQPAPGAALTNPQPGEQHVEVELKSDAAAPDFRGYLTRILAIVRANWRRVTPASVRMGTLRGENTIEMVINRDGSIPKLVIGDPSNVEALDQASVAGVSMSNPLPPLPDDFQGQQVRVTFTFKYNMPE